jgi:HlyD family secretion protein
VVRIPVREGEIVKAGTPILILDNSVQRATAESAKAQIAVAKANLANLQSQYSKQKASWTLDPRSVSRDALDNAEHNVKAAKANLELVQKQYQASSALLAKYAVKAVSDATVLSVNTAVGSYISSQGVYDTYTQVSKPVIVMGNVEGSLAVRCYIDEILIHRLPDSAHMNARMYIHGTNMSIPLAFVRVQPNVSPKVELSSQRTERVDVRVLPIIFSFVKPKDFVLYPGQLVDVYISEQAARP